MFADFIRIGSSAVGLPLGAAWRSWCRLRSGDHAVLDVRIEPVRGAEEAEHLLAALRRAASDPCVEAIVFRIDGPLGGWAANQDLRAAIRALAAAGKATYAFVEQPGNAAMWIAGACDRIFAVPTGELHLVGVGAELTFFGTALERLGVRPDFEAAGAYKSFGEPFTRSFASPENLEAIEALVDDLHGQLVRDLAADRRIPETTVQALLDRAPLSAEEAVVAKLVDELLYADQLDRWIEEHHGERAKRVPFAQWASRAAVAAWIDGLGEPGGAVAVLHLDGPIVMDDKTARVAVRARTVAPMLAELRKDARVAAVVLHVNSQGGSALASDLIWREVEQLRRAKPVVASFHDVAASGGYYLAAPAVEILARPATLTGSIGVFGGKLVLGDGLRRLGVNHQPVLAGANATLFSPSRRFTDAQRARFRGMLQRFYDGFVERVASGRRVPEEAIEPHCRGRVWTGRMAGERGLVDRLGTLEDAVARARVLAGLPSTARRRDLSGQPHRPMLARWAQEARRHAVPQLARASGAIAWAERLVGGAEAVELLAAHEGEPMAMLPFEIRAR